MILTIDQVKRLVNIQKQAYKNRDYCKYAFYSKEQNALMVTNSTMLVAISTNDDCTQLANNLKAVNLFDCCKLDKNTKIDINDLKTNDEIIAPDFAKILSLQKELSGYLNGRVYSSINFELWTRLISTFFLSRRLGCPFEVLGNYNGMLCLRASETVDQKLIIHGFLSPTVIY